MSFFTSWIFYSKNSPSIEIKLVQISFLDPKTQKVNVKMSCCTLRVNISEVVPVR